VQLAGDHGGRQGGAEALLEPIQGELGAGPGGFLRRAPLRRMESVHQVQVDAGAAVGRGDVDGLVDGEGECALLEQRGDLLEQLPGVDLDDQLPDAIPVLRTDAPQHLRFALLDVDLQQIDAFESVLVDDAGERPQRAPERLGAIPLREQSVDVGGLRHGVRPVAAARR